jgi:hypothetical protein
MPGFPKTVPFFVAFHAAQKVSFFAKKITKSTLGPTKVPGGVVVGAPQFGNAKDMEGCEYPEALVAGEYQEHLSRGASEAPCAKVRKAAAYVKKPEALESEAGGESPEKVSAAGSRRERVL